MKKIFTLASLFALVAFTQNVRAQSEDEMKKWNDYMKPGKMHELMASWEGQWTANISLWRKVQSKLTRKIVLKL